MVKKKEIQVPLELLNKVIKPANDPKNKFSFINEELYKNNGRIKSTQNFLQGMFNCSSSYTVVCCFNYTYYIW